MRMNGINHIFWENVQNVPISCLKVSARERISMFLIENENNVDTTPNGYNKSWKGVGEFLGFSHIELMWYAQGKDPFGSILRTLEHETIGYLVKIFNALDKYSILEDEVLQKLVTENANDHLTIDSEESDKDQVKDSRNEEIPSNLVQTYPISERYDAMIVYSPKNFSFVQNAMEILKKEPFKLNLCIPDRDMTANKFQADAWITLLKECPKVVCVTSKVFIKSQLCHFVLNNTNFSCDASNDDKVICVLIEKIEDWSSAPLLENRTKLHYIKGPRGQWFWENIEKSIRN